MVIVMGGEMNCAMVGSMTNQQKADGRAEYRTAWDQKVLEL